jgi:hypothetical protein
VGFSLWDDCLAVLAVEIQTSGDGALIVISDGFGHVAPVRRSDAKLVSA